MADYIELANSYFRLLHWVENAEGKSKNAALRSLERINRFLKESNVELIDLTGQPFSEGWAVNVMKVDESVPEDELVFTKMVKPIIHVNGELKQEGEVYVGKIDCTDTKATQPETVEMPVSQNDDQAQPNDAKVEKSNTTSIAVSDWFKQFFANMQTWFEKNSHLMPGIACIVILIIVILLVCVLGNQLSLRAVVENIENKVEEIADSDYSKQSEGAAIVTYEIRNGDNTIVVTQPMDETIVSNVDIGGVPVTITTNTEVDSEEGMN